MKKLFYLILSLCFALQAYGQSTTVDYDPNYITENLPKAPESSDLGQYGEIVNNTYTGKANVAIPLHVLEFDGLQIPIQLNYDTGGVRVQPEASWVGLNWSLSPHVGITRTINGSDDLNEGVVPPGGANDISAFVFNDIEVQYPPGSSAYVEQNDVNDIHDSFGTYVSVPGNSKLYADMQPDIYEVSLFGKRYKFRFKKRQGSSNIIDTHIFNSTNAVITYDLSAKSFTVTDEMGYRFEFTTKDYSTPFTSQRSSSGTGNNSSDVREFTIVEMKSDPFGQDNTVLTSWLLDRITSPRGRVLDFTYKKGAHFSVINYSGSVKVHDNYTNQQNADSGTSLIANDMFTSMMHIIENNYLEKIEGAFGSIEFLSEGRKDLMTGNDVRDTYQTYIGNTIAFTTGSSTQPTVYTHLHGTNPNDIVGAKLNGILVKDYNGNQIKDITFENSYFNSDEEGNSDEALYLRLKLDKVTVNDKEYSFEYELPNALPRKDTDDVDFWGFYNGAGNTTNVPSIGRFVTTIIDNNAPNLNNLAQTFFKYNGANKGSNFNYGQIGLLTKISYPTGGNTVLEYEANDAVVDVTQPYLVTESFPSGRLRWTNLLNEDSYNFTYQYLKNAQDPNYKLFDHEFVQDPNAPGVSIGANFSTDHPSMVRVEADLYNPSPNGGDCLPDYIGCPLLVVTDQADSSIYYTLIYYDDFVPNATTPVVRQVMVPPGEYRIELFDGCTPGPGGCTFIAAVLNREYTLFESDGTNTLDLLERFEIGGARIKSITNKGNGDEFINKKLFTYNLPGASDPTLASSGVLMDELVYFSKAYGYYAYSPRFNQSGSFNLSSSSSIRTSPSAEGSYIGYTSTTETDLDANGNALGIIERTFKNTPNFYYKDSFSREYLVNSTSGSGVNVSIQNTLLTGLPPFINHGHSNGNVLAERIYGGSGELLQFTENQYNLLNLNPDDTHFANFMAMPLDDSGSGTPGPFFLSGETYTTYRLNDNGSRKSVPSSSHKVEYFGGQQLYTDSYNEYDLSTGDLIGSELVVSDGDSRIVKYYYPYSTEVYNNPGMAGLRSNNEYSIIVKSQEYKNDTQLSDRELGYLDFQGNMLVSKLSSSKGQTPLEERILYDKYSDDGRLLQITQKDGITSSYIWGYNQEYVVAKVENATYTQIEALSSFGQDFTIQEGLSTIQESQLRNIAGTMVSTYTYNPMIGVTTIKDARGNTQTFDYDVNNRLEHVYDLDNNLVSHFEYNINPELIEDFTEPGTATSSFGNTTAETVITRSDVTQNGTVYNALYNYIELIDTQYANETYTYTYEASPSGGSGNLEYRWKVKGGQFTPYSTGTTWTYDFDCTSQDVRGLEIICEVRDTTLDITDRDRVVHVTMCNN